MASPRNPTAVFFLSLAASCIAWVALEAATFVRLYALVEFDLVNPQNAVLHGASIHLLEMSVALDGLFVIAVIAASCRFNRQKGEKAAVF